MHTKTGLISSVLIKDVMVFDNILLDLCIDKGTITYKISDKTVNVMA